ncbi:MAG: GNAT family N-acetyltransferase [Planctomycetes bacterium]|nr:GNAT family N-acetyltransferase [Planctomycetota bacterium]
MSQANPNETQPEIHVRTYRDGDHAAVERLYTDGHLSGQIAPNDTGMDIENIHDAYFSEPANHLWVAEEKGRVVGMIGVACDGQTAEIRRLRVQKDLQQTPIAARLVETALSHIRHHGMLKVVLDTHFEASAQALFEKFGFHHTRTKNAFGKDILEFYLDIYRQPKREP